MSEKVFLNKKTGHDDFHVSDPKSHFSFLVGGAEAILPTSRGGCVVVDVSYSEKIVSCDHERVTRARGEMTLNIYKLSFLEYKIYQEIKKFKKKADVVSEPVLSRSKDVYYREGDEVSGKSNLSNYMEDKFFGFDDIEGESKLAVERARRLIIEEYKEQEKEYIKSVEEYRKMESGESIVLDLKNDGRE